MLRVALSLITPCGLPFAVATGLGIASSWLATLVQGNITRFIGTYLESGDTSGLPYLYTAAGLVIISAITAAGRGSLFTHLNQKMYSYSARRIFHNITHAKMDTWDKDMNTDHLSKCVLGDIAEVVQASSLLVNVLARTSTTIVCVGWIIHSISPRLYAWGVILSLLHVAIFHFLHPWHAKYADATRDAKLKLETHMNEYITKHTSLILYSWQSVYQDMYADLASAHSACVPPEARAYATMMLVGQIFPKMLELAFIWLVVNEGFGFGVVMEVMSYHHMLNDAISSLKHQSMVAWESRDRVARFSEAYEGWGQEGQEEQEEKEGQEGQDIDYDDASTAKSIEMRNITFAYPTRTKQVFNNFTMSISAGERVAIVAPSGSGKTTLIKLLMGIYPVKSGSIYIGERNIKNISSKHMRALVNIVPQDPILFSNRTLRENLCMGCQEPVLDMMMRRVLDRVQLNEFSLDEPLVEMSGGQKQRLAIARMLISEAGVLILDEPTSALDQETMERVMQYVRQYAQDKTVILITHHAAIVKNMRIVRL